MEDITTTYDKLEREYAAAQRLLEGFRKEHASVFLGLEELQRALNETRDAASQLLGRFARCWEDNCTAAFERSTLKLVQLPNHVLVLVNCDGEQGPEGWTTGMYYCGDGSDGNLHCPAHPQAEEEQSRCGNCSR